MLKGRATAEGTRRYAMRFPRSSSAFRPLGTTGLVVSPVGFGCYRIDERVSTHRESLRKALRQGCNLIDTSTNYTDGASERGVGRVLAEAIGAGELQRDEVAVVSKVGYVQGGNLELAWERESQGRPFPEMVKYMDGCWHCIHPAFIEDQLGRSLERLGLETLDAMLLHNPEYYFSDAQENGTNMSFSELREAFYARIEAAFEQLEREVDRGRIASYGVSSNTFGGDPSELGTTSVSRMWDIARAVALRLRGDPDKHHFRTVQLPFNLFESGPYLTPNAGTEQQSTALEFSRAHGLAVLVNRPLNAFFEGQLIRLAEPPAAASPAARRVADLVKEHLAPALSAAWLAQSLSRQAIGVAMHTPGVTCVLNGMRRESYVDDTMGVAELEPLAITPDTFAPFSGS